MIEQRAGNVSLRVFTDGFPLWSDLSVKSINGDLHELRLAVSDLHDIRYCIDRVLAGIKPNDQ